MALGALLLDTTRGDNPIRSNLAADTQPADQKKMPDFLTLESLTFPLASGAVVIGWKVVQAIGGGWADNRVWPLAIAGLIVVAALLSKWNDLGSTPSRLGALLIGLVNSLLLAAGALGVETQIINGG